MFRPERLSIGAIISLLLLCSACAETTAAGLVTDPTFRPAAQRAQFYLTADAAVSRERATVEALANQIARTASAATQTQLAVTQQAGAQATAAMVTQQAVSTQAARDATLTAVHDIDATATAYAGARAALESTQAAKQQATATAAVVGTQTVIHLRQLEADANREQVAAWGLAIIVALGAGVTLLVALGAGAALVRRLQVVYYGLHRNPLVMIGDAVYDPIAKTWSGDEIPEELQAQLTTGLQQVLALQAAHSPHPHGKNTKHSFTLGPLSTSAESTPVTESVTVAEKDKPAITAVPTSPAIEAPKEKLHPIFVQGQSTSEADRDICDLREFVERGALVGFARSSWLGHKYESGHDGTRERFERLTDICIQAGVIEPTGKTHRLAVSADQALAALGAERMG